MFGDLDWPLNASRWFVSICWASCYLYNKYVYVAIVCPLNYSTSKTVNLALISLGFGAIFPLFVLDQTNKNANFGVSVFFSKSYRKLPTNFTSVTYHVAMLLILTSPRIPIKHPNFKGHLSSVHVVYIGQEHFSVDCMHDALGYCTRKSKTTIMYKLQHRRE